MSRARIIAVVNQKGGVGKTTTAVNLAACFAASERRTLLIDLDPQANAASAFGAVSDVGNSPHQIYDVLIGECGMQQASIPTELAYLRIVPSGQDLVGAEIELVDLPDRERRLAHPLEAVRTEYDIVVIDCPPSLGILTLNALTAADSILIPLQCEYYALEGLARLLDTIQLVRANLNPSLQVEGIALTMVDMRNNLSRQVEAEVRGHFGDSVYRSRIPRNVRLSEAPSHGKPILLYDIHSRGAVAYLKLAEEILSKWPRKAELGTLGTSGTSGTSDTLGTSRTPGPSGPSGILDASGPAYAAASPMAAQASPIASASEHVPPLADVALAGSVDAVGGEGPVGQGAVSPGSVEQASVDRSPVGQTRDPIDTIDQGEQGDQGETNEQPA